MTRKLEALANPVKHDIVDRLVALGPLSVRDLASALGRRPTAIYRYLDGLIGAGLVTAGKISVGVGRPAVIYRANGRRLSHAQAVRNSANRKLLTLGARTVAAQAVKEYQLGFIAPNWSASGSNRNHRVARILCAPSPRKLGKMNALLDQLAELACEPDSDPGPLVRLVWFLTPVG